MLGWYACAFICVLFTQIKKQAECVDIRIYLHRCICVWSFLQGLPSLAPKMQLLVQHKSYAAAAARATQGEEFLKKVSASIETAHRLICQQIPLLETMRVRCFRRLEFVVWLRVSSCRVKDYRGAKQSTCHGGVPKPKTERGTPPFWRRPQILKVQSEGG